MSESPLFIGIKGTVVAIDRATGQEIWRTRLEGDDFVNVVVDDRELYAATQGQLFRLDAITGRIRWYNELKGLGFGLVTIASAQNQQAILIRQHAHQGAPAAPDDATGAAE